MKILASSGSAILMSLLILGFLAAPAPAETHNGLNTGQAETGTPAARSDESLETLYERLVEAETQWDQARRALRKARQRRYPRGPALEELRQRARENQEAVGLAEEAFLRRVEKARYTTGETRDWNIFVERAEQIQEARLQRSNSR